MMTKNTQTRTLLSLLTLLLALALNTFFELASVYTEFWAWTVAAAAAIACIASLRTQHRARGAQLSVLYAAPFVLMALGAIAFRVLG
jgi:hypothetical protein